MVVGSKFKKQGRVFLNVLDKSCTAACVWQVEIWTYGDALNPKKKKTKPNIEAEFGVNREGQSFYVSRKADLRPLQALQRELNKFNQAYEEAEILLEEMNAKSKDTD